MIPDVAVEAAAAIGLAAVLDPISGLHILPVNVVGDVCRRPTYCVPVTAETAAGMCFDADKVWWYVEPPATIPTLVVDMFGERHHFPTVTR